MVEEYVWGHERLRLRFEWSDTSPVSLVGIRQGGRIVTLSEALPIVEILSASTGHTLASARLVHTSIGQSLRHLAHRESRDGDASVLTFDLESTEHGVRARLTIESHDRVDALRASVEVENIESTPLVLQSVTSWSSAFTPEGVGDRLADWTLVSGASDWLGEGRWSRSSLRGEHFPELSEHLTRHDPRGSLSVRSVGTWSTGDRLPVAVIESRDSRSAWAWQIEHNGPWRWEIGEDTRGGYLALSGPTESDSSWTKVLERGQSFHSVPVSVAFGDDAVSAIAALTDQRRVSRRKHPDNTAMPVVFNDYMNTLDGDPTTEKLFPLIEAAGRVGADIFCIDAGWYDDSGVWWDTVGEWKPSTTRFPGGLGEVIDAITAAGMVPGLWLEPEVIGTRSALAESLPREAFLLRHGQRVVEQDRYHLDLRHPVAVAHLDTVVDRLVSEFGIGFFKFDYNIDPGSGTDHDADSLGDGLLGHNRAHLAWLDGLLDRHPTLVIENCASGAMRMDAALMSRLAMQSTSDQQDPIRYPPIAAAAPLSVLPEQAASWAYPQPSMSSEESAFALVTGLLGRFYVSGYLNRMSEDQLALVFEAIEAAKALRTHIATAHAHWPSGFPSWNDEWVSLALRTPESDVVSVWRRGAAGAAETVLAFPHLVGRDLRVETVFPLGLPRWDSEWDALSGHLTVRAGDTPVAARTLRLTPVPTD